METAGIVERAAEREIVARLDNVLGILDRAIEGLRKGAFGRETLDSNDCARRTPVELFERPS